MTTQTVSYGIANSRLAFISMHTPESGAVRDAHLTLYAVRPIAATGGTRYDLVRSSVPVTGSVTSTGDTANAYWSDGWAALPGAEEATLLRNVALFRAAAPQSAGYGLLYDSRDTDNANMPPVAVDVYLEVMDERDARQASEMERLGVAQSNITEFIEYRVRRFTARSHPLQREGYQSR
jgi:hypothetical protein